MCAHFANGTGARNRKAFSGLKNKLPTRVCTLVDTDALDFMATHDLVLAGDVHRVLAVGIKRTILSGIATGKGAEDIARNLWTVVTDPESFRRADGREPQGGGLRSERPRAAVVRMLTGGG